MRATAITDLARAGGDVVPRSTSEGTPALSAVNKLVRFAEKATINMYQVGPQAEMDQYWYDQHRTHKGLLAPPQICPPPAPFQGGSLRTRYSVLNTESWVCL